MSDHLSRSFPVGAVQLDVSDPAGLEAYLRRRLWLPAWGRVERVERAGDGNMNLTLRVTTTAGSLVVKQGRPWVEKYPHIPAPWGRTSVDGLCYEIAARAPDVGRRVPDLIGLDDDSQVLAVRDLGPASDFSDLYRGAVLTSGDLGMLAEWISAFHALPVPGEHRGTLANRAMRALNHEYIFLRPFDTDGGPDLEALCPGLDRVWARLRADRDLVAAMAAIGEHYLRDGDCLVHGDFFPGSWLRGTAGPWIIDFEFAFLGEPEFDLGVMAAHLHLAQLPARRIAEVLDAYAVHRCFNRSLASRYAGAEIVRRLVGVAQLPLTAGLDERHALLDLGCALVRGERDVAA